MRPNPLADYLPPDDNDPNALPPSATGPARYAAPKRPNPLAEHLPPPSQAGAPASVRAIVGNAPSPQDALATLRQYYPDARPHGDDNFVFTDPQTGEDTIYNPSGLDMGDWASIGRTGAQMVGGIGGGALGFAAGVPTGPGAVATAAGGAALGSQAAGQGYDAILRRFGTVDTRSLGQLYEDMLIETSTEAGLNVAGPVVAKGVKTLGGKAISAVMRDSSKASNEVADAVKRLDIAPNARLTSNKAVVGAADTVARNAPTSAGVMRKAYEKTTESVNQAFNKVRNNYSEEITKEAAGRSIRRGAESFVDRFQKQASKNYDALDEFLPASKPITLRTTSETLKESLQEFENAPNISKSLLPQELRGWLTDIATDTTPKYTPRQVEKRVADWIEGQGPYLKSIHPSTRPSRLNGGELPRPKQTNPNMRMQADVALPRDAAYGPEPQYSPLYHTGRSPNTLSGTPKPADISGPIGIGTEAERVMLGRAALQNRIHTGLDTPDYPAMQARLKEAEGVRLTPPGDDVPIYQMRDGRQISMNDIREMATKPEWYEPSPSLEGEMTWGQVKAMRSHVGRMADDPRMVSDIPKGQWKQLYAALSNDMEAAARAAGPKAERAFSRANAHYAAGRQRIDDHLNDLVKSPATEAAFNAAFRGSKDGATRLRAIRKSVDKGDWGDLVAVKLNEMGVDPRTNQFSPSRFLTEYNKLSKSGAAEALVEGTEWKALKPALDDLVTVSQRMVDTRFNELPISSGDAFGRMLALGGGVAAVGATTGGVGAGTVVTGAVAPWATAKLITNPRFVRWLTKAAQIPPKQVSKKALHMRQLANIAATDAGISDAVGNYLESLGVNAAAYFDGKNPQRAFPEANGVAR